MSFPRRSQPGGRGKPAGRSITRRMQRRYRAPPGIAGRGGNAGGDSVLTRGSLVLSPGDNGRGRRPHRRSVGGTSGQHGRESREGLGGRFRRARPAKARGISGFHREVPGCPRDWRMGSYNRGGPGQQNPAGAEDPWGQRRRWQGRSGRLARKGCEQLLFDPVPAPVAKARCKPRRGQGHAGRRLNLVSPGAGSH